MVNQKSFIIGEPVTFQYKSFLLYGMLDYPSPDSAVNQKTGIILLNAGLTDRAGPLRFYVKLAKCFSQQGYHVLRFDARGVGESEGGWGEMAEGSPTTNLFIKIQQGIWVPDTHAAIDFMVQKVGVHCVILGGLCGGAITALISSKKHPKVKGLFLIGTPVTLSSVSGNINQLPEETLRKESTQYFYKLFKLSAWIRILTFQTDYKTFWNIFFSRLSRIIGIKQYNIKNVMDKVSPFFLNGFSSAVEKKMKMIFIYSENDYLFQEFKEYFLSVIGKSNNFDLDIIPQANHNMTEDASQERLREILTSWLAKTFNGLSGVKK